MERWLNTDTFPLLIRKLLAGWQFGSHFLSSLVSLYRPSSTNCFHNNMQFNLKPVHCVHLLSKFVLPQIWIVLQYCITGLDMTHFSNCRQRDPIHLCSLFCRSHKNINNVLPNLAATLHCKLENAACPFVLCDGVRNKIQLETAHWIISMWCTPKCNLHCESKNNTFRPCF